MANKVRYGLKNAHYAVATVSGGVVTYGTPKALTGAVALTLEPQGDSSKFYADDILYFSRFANNGYEGTLEMAMISDEFLVDCLGQQLDVNDMLIEKASDAPSYFALLFEFTADEKAVRHCMYYCTASRPTQSGDTTKESVEVKTEELKFTAAPLPSTEVVHSKTTVDTSSSVYNSWYTAVPMPDLAELSISPKSATTDGTSTLVFTVTGGTVDAVKENGVALTVTTDYTVSGNTLTLTAAYLSGLAAGTHNLVAYAGTDNVAFKVKKS